MSDELEKLKEELASIRDAAILRGVVPSIDGKPRELPEMIADALHETLKLKDVLAKKEAEINALKDKCLSLENELRLVKALHAVTVVQRDRNQHEIDRLTGKLDEPK